MTRPSVIGVRAAILSSMVVALACTANVQDLGAPEPPPDPHVTNDPCLRWPSLHGTPCDATEKQVCNPTSTLQCVCGFDGTWVCLDGSLGLLTAHALEKGSPCGGGVVYGNATNLCTCDDVGELTCRRRERVVPDSEHAP